MPNSYPPKTLVVSSFSSKCGDCGRSANPASKTHDVLLGYGPTNGDPGCGVEWENVATVYCGPVIEAATRALRPDLNYIGPLSPDHSQSRQCPDCGASGGGHYFHCRTNAVYVQPLKARTTFEHEWAAPATELPASRKSNATLVVEADLEEALAMLRRLDKAAQRVYREFNEPDDAQEPWNELLAARVKAVGVLAKHRKDNT